MNACDRVGNLGSASGIVLLSPSGRGVVFNGLVVTSGVVPVLALLAIVAGIIAAIAGFGIGSVLTPAMAYWYPAKMAVAAVSIPHLAATAYRLWLVREHVDFSVLRSFGLMSAAGGLIGAVAQTWLASRYLEVILSVLLIFVGVGGWLGYTKKMRFAGIWAWLAGALSGFLGGLVGNQGGLRSGAMLGLGVPRDAFIATATATGVIVDAARMPVYLAMQWKQLSSLGVPIAVMTTGVLVGTVIGTKVLRTVPEAWFTRVVSALLVILGVWLAVKP
jgi:hypothetical protein